MKIKYYFCFKEDKRSSMDMLGNFISNGQKKYKKNLVKSIIPKTFTPNWINKYNFIMRFERFVNYPIQSYFTKKTPYFVLLNTRTNINPKALSSAGPADAASRAGPAACSSVFANSTWSDTRTRARRSTN